MGPKNRKSENAVGVGSTKELEVLVMDEADRYVPLLARVGGDKGAYSYSLAASSTLDSLPPSPDSSRTSPNSAEQVSFPQR